MSDQPNPVGLKKEISGHPTDHSRKALPMEAIDFYKANATNIVNVPRVNHPEDPSGWAGVRRVSEAGIFAKDAPVMSLDNACDFAEKYAAYRMAKAEGDGND